MSRRGAFGVIAGLGALAVSACGTRQKKLAAACRDAAQKVDGVRSADLEPWGAAEFQSGLQGTIELEGSGSSEVLAQYDAAMRAIVTTVYDVEGADRADYCGLGNVTGRGADGHEVDAMALDPAWPEGATPSRGAVTAGSFAERYGLG